MQENSIEGADGIFFAINQLLSAAAADGKGILKEFWSEFLSSIDVLS